MAPFAPVAAAPAPVVPAVHIVKHESFHSKESPFAQEGQHQTAAPISQRGGMQAPGGASTLSFGDDSVVAAPVVKRAPGGTSTLSFGDDTEGFTPRGPCAADGTSRACNSCSTLQFRVTLCC